MTPTQTPCLAAVRLRMHDMPLALSLAGLMVLSAGDRILSLPAKYLRWGHAWQLILGISVLTLLLSILREISRRKTFAGRSAKVMFFLLPLAFLPDALTSLNGVTPLYLGFISFLGRLGFSAFVGRTLVLVVVLTGLATLAYLVLRTKANHWLQKGLILFSALPFILILQVCIRLGFRSPAPLHRSQLPPRRVVWLVFDELDQPILAASLDTLPGFRSLAKKSLVCSQAHAPGNYTDLSLPSLWTGEPVFDASSSSRGGLLIKPGPDAPWSREWLKGRTVFERIHALGQGVHIVGWHLPYCALFPDRLGFTTEDSSHFAAPGPDLNIFTWMVRDNLIWNQLYALNSRRFQDDLPRYENELEHIPKGHLGRRIRDLVDNQESSLTEAIKNSSAALVFGHLGAPHLPLSSKSPSVNPKDPETDYLHNLARCDQFLTNAVLPSIQESSIPTMLIVTSDHWFRFAEAKSQARGSSSPTSRRPIPFLIFLSGNSSEPGSYERGFNTERTRELVEAFLAGRIDSFDEVKQRMDTWPDSPTRVWIR